MADRHAAGQALDDLFRAEIIADEARTAMRAELLAVKGDDAGGFLAAMLQRVQAERRQCRRVGMAVDPEDAAFVMKMVRVALAGRHSLPPSSGRSGLAEYRAGAAPMRGRAAPRFTI